MADVNNNRIQVFTATGGFITKFGSFGSGDGQFGGTSELAIGGSCTLYVADLGNDRIQKFV